MWAIYRANVLRALINRRYSGDSAKFAEFIAKEYDSCMKRGGDTIWGVPVINGNTTAMANVIKTALEKGVSKTGSNFNIMEEIVPAAFDAYWLGAEMAPLPNPIFKPLGWASTPPAPGTIQNIGPDISSLAASTARHVALVKAIQLLIDDVKGKTINIQELGEINVYETAEKIQNGEKVDNKIKNNPFIKSTVELLKKLKEAKNKKPSSGGQLKRSIKIPFPKLPDRQKIIKETKEKLTSQAEETVKQELKRIISEQVIKPYVEQIKASLSVISDISKPTEEEIKKWVKDQINGVTSDVKLPSINLPALPTKEDFENQINNLFPSKEEIKARVESIVLKLMPEIPYFNFLPPTLKINFSHPFINPFINYAKQHLINTGGIINVISNYPGPVPAPAIINWSGYRVLD